MQIDGVFGGSAGIAEMLVQSQSGCIEFLPALPDSWKTGHIEGLKVRGGGEVSAVWNNGVLRKITLKSIIANSFSIKIPTNWDINKLKQTNLNTFGIENGNMVVRLKANELFAFQYP
jgi:alpha-L-fucosidase 2